MPNLRSSGGIISEINHVDEELSQLHTILEPIQISINEFNRTLDDIKRLYKAKFLQQKSQIHNLQTRGQSLEERLSYQQFSTDLNARKIDDLEQGSRKDNSKLKGIEVKNNDSPNLIMEVINAGIIRLNLTLTNSDLDRCHRVGKIYNFKFKSQQDIEV